MSKNRTLLLLIGSLIFGVLLWSSIFNLLSGSLGTPVSNNYTDSLSGRTVNKEPVNDAAAAYPLSPYFVGFDNLQQYTIPDSDTELRYVKDFIATYVMEHTAQKPSAVSFVKDSLDGPNFNSQTYETTYSFKFGINDTDIHDISVDYNPVTPTITVSISQDSSVEAHRTFTVYYDKY
ncbi:MAG TPA: hypothetical protein VN031_01155 [Candidatus Microsaccharimonas sp.]|nr:hypothetical protein [Candidatus Microsaccharimonas sp.]